MAWQSTVVENHLTFTFTCLEMICFLPSKTDSHFHKFSFLALVKSVVLQIKKGFFFFFKSEIPMFFFSL